MIRVGILNTELIVCVHSTINHLWIVIVSLCLNLMTHVLLENIIWLITHLLWVLNGSHHIWLCQMWVVPTLERFKLILPWRHNGFVWVCGANVVILKSLCASNPIGCITTHHLLILHTTHLILLVAHELLLLCHHHLLIILILAHILLASVEWNLNSSICVSYVIKIKYWRLLNKNKFC